MEITFKEDKVSITVARGKEAEDFALLSAVASHAKRIFIPFDVAVRHSLELFIKQKGPGLSPPPAPTESAGVPSL